MLDCRTLIGGLTSPTKRELEALRLLSQGLNGIEAAKSMGISYQTLKNHLGHVYLKLGVHSELHAVLKAIRRGLI